MEYRPVGHDDPDAGFYGGTRVPLSYLTPVLGQPAARAAVWEADNAYPMWRFHKDAEGLVAISCVDHLPGSAAPKKRRHP